ncbi:hypothetical protein GJ496_006729 [Pomphorhynchus laevis]|nr:hypothetical protein GJ496_006729 [Pomphorhynchus laevis]
MTETPLRLKDTSRPKQANEENGKGFWFVDRSEIVTEIAAKEYLEYGTHEDHIYGTKLSTVRSIIQNKYTPVLDVEPQAVQIIRNSEFSPLIVFIQPPNVSSVKDIICENSEQLEQLMKETDIILSTYAHLIDMVIPNVDVEYVVESVHNAIEDCEHRAQWVPASWIY